MKEAAERLSSECKLTREEYTPILSSLERDSFANLDFFHFATLVGIPAMVLEKATQQLEGRLTEALNACFRSKR